MSICIPTEVFYNCIERVLKVPFYILLGFGILGWIGYLYNKMYVNSEFQNES